MLNMEDVLAALESTANPEESFNAALQGEEKIAEAKETEKVAEAKETETPETPEDSEMAKIAEADAQGRIMARAFFDEINKLAVAPVAEYPADRGSIVNNPAIEVSRGDLAQPHPEITGPANAIISQLTAPNKAGAGEIATPAGVQPNQRVPLETGSAPLAYDTVKAQETAATGAGQVVKTGAYHIVDTIYNKYFKEEN